MPAKRGRGDYQLILDTVEPAGDGALRLAFDALKEKLSADPGLPPEGLLLATERIGILDDALQQLSPNARQALLLSRIDGMTQAQPHHSAHALSQRRQFDGCFEPLLDMGLRLGEGSGAALAVPLMRLACDLHGQMATFAQAAVADRPA